MIGWLSVVISMLATIGLWWSAKGINPIETWELAASQLLALLGIMSLSWTYILAIRHNIIERYWGGLDLAYKAHHILGGLAFVALINHVLLLIVDSLPYNKTAIYLIPGRNLAYTLGIAALYILLFLLVLTLYVRLPYRYWKWSHEWMGIVIILGGLHGLLVSSDTTLYAPLWYWVLGWSVLATVSFAYKRFGYYWRNIEEYKIIKSGRDNNLLVVQLEACARIIKFSPGQYGFFSFPDRPRDEHAFSILGSDERLLIIGVKVFGNFTKKLSLASPNSRLLINGPFGTFGEKMATAKHCVWVAGGIGITPFLSMARAIRAEQKVEMYFCARVMPASVITEPFVMLEKTKSNFKFLPCETSHGERLTGARIFEDTSSDKSATYFLCGPSSMMENLAEQLAQLGIARSHIIYEDFAFK